MQSQKSRWRSYLRAANSDRSATSVQGKENEIQQQCRPIPDEFPHQEPGNAVLVENNFSTSSTSVSRYGDQRSFPQYFYNCSVNVHNNYSSRWVWAWTLQNTAVREVWITVISVQLLIFSFNCSHGGARIMWSWHHVVLAPESHITFWSFLTLKWNLAKPKVENLIKQLFHSRLLDMRLVVAIIWYTTEWEGAWVYSWFDVTNWFASH